jgi:hypothetical protein
VFDPQQRQRLVSVAQSLVAAAPAEATMGVEGAGGGGTLPGVPSTWDMHSASPEVGGRGGRRRRSGPKRGVLALGPPGAARLELGVSNRSSEEHPAAGFLPPPPLTRPSHPTP